MKRKFQLKDVTIIRDSNKLTENQMDLVKGGASEGGKDCICPTKNYNTAGGNCSCDTGNKNIPLQTIVVAE
ncbi:MAG: hypothetical protein LBS69_06120 [Prevotellaceae bacterium]|jgi:hypothetical protein|nr:hypothetical protein [Prevotellaceae bacterium]